MKRLELLKKEALLTAGSPSGMPDVLFAEGVSGHYHEAPVVYRAYGIARMFTGGRKHIYPHDMIAGSIRGMFDAAANPEIVKRAKGIADSVGRMDFWLNSDHYTPDYAEFLEEGVDGRLSRIDASLQKYAGDKKKTDFLRAAGITMQAFSGMLEGYAEEAERMALLHPEQSGNFHEMARACRKVAHEPPDTFREALQLMWMTHEAFVWEGRYAMAFGRMDQFLYPYYRKDIDAGRITRGEALEMLSCTLIKIADTGRDDVCNIAIGGVKPEDGKSAVNELTYLLLDAVGACGIPGPNLSARISSDAPDEFLDACLRLIGTGIGYPALMNDEVNIPALHRHGYTLEDCRNYTMVGCIENFITAKQPPWSDGRYNSPKYLELTLNNGVCMQTGIRMGPETGDAEEIGSMEEFMDRLRIQMEAGACEYVENFLNYNDRYNRERRMQPFLSCFCHDCIGRGLDINMGGALYPSVHGACAMGIGTMADSLAAIEKLIFAEKRYSIAELRDALRANFEGYGEMRKALLAAPKYGNDDDFVDKYAVWFVKEHERLFAPYRTPDGGPFYTAIASNTASVYAGHQVAATPDGRMNGEALSDAASPMHGMDRSGPTATVLSTTKPDYTLVSCGTVLNQKYSPAMFEDEEKRARLLALIRVYFARGGQEMQINSISRGMLIDAMEHPEAYRSLVVRVSGFSAYYTTLGREVQEDILKRTEQG